MARRYTHVYQFKITLKTIQPTVWRRIQVPANYTFWDLHVAIQDAMGWLDYHLHRFEIVSPLVGRIVEIGLPEHDDYSDEFNPLPGWSQDLADYFSKGNHWANYEYDFGDGWEHEIVLESILLREKGAKYPVCLDGRRACPPEDCGGTRGYARLLKVLSDPTHEEHESIVAWLPGPYDPEQFDPARVHFDNPKKRWTLAFSCR